MLCHTLKVPWPEQVGASAEAGKTTANSRLMRICDSAFCVMDKDQATFPTQFPT